MYCIFKKFDFYNFIRQINCIEVKNRTISNDFHHETYWQNRNKCTLTVFNLNMYWKWFYFVRYLAQKSKIIIAESCYFRGKQISIFIPFFWVDCLIEDCALDNNSRFRFYLKKCRVFMQGSVIYKWGPKYVIPVIPTYTLFFFIHIYVCLWCLWIPQTNKLLCSLDNEDSRFAGNKETQ